MKYAILLILSCSLFSCSDSFINHDLQAERVGACAETVQPIKMVSNINGQRYEFFSCLDDGFDAKNYTVDRQGDSIIVTFPKTPAANKAMYKLILDVDAKPRYTTIIIDGRELNDVPSSRL